MIKAVIFDLDGVLIDACHLHYEAFNKALLSVVNFELTYEEHVKIFNGLPTKNKLDILLSQERIDETDAAAISKLKKEFTNAAIEALPINENRIEILKELKKFPGILEIKVVTNSIYSATLAMLTKTGLIQYINEIIAGDFVKRPKPDPEGYLYAMNGYDPFEVLIVEDSPYGIAAAKASGANVLEIKEYADLNLEMIKERL